MRKAPLRLILPGLCAAIVTLSLPACGWRAEGPAPTPEPAAIPVSPKNPISDIADLERDEKAELKFRAMPGSRAPGAAALSANDAADSAPDSPKAGDDPRAGVPDPKVID